MAGKFLLAHELTHVVQQDEGKLQKNINRSPSQQVPGISTPIPAGMNPTPAGDFEITINGAKLIIKPDTHSRRKGKDAKTQCNLVKGGVISGIKTDKAKIVSFNGPSQLVMTIQTTYQKNASDSDTSSYGRGTTAADKTAGATSLGFHEGNHGIDYLGYLQANPLPVFSGAAGMSMRDFKKSAAKYKTELEKYFKDMNHSSELNTDCVGTTKDQAQGTNICRP